MRKTLLGLLVLCGLVSVGVAGVCLANRAVGGAEPAITVSPNVIVLAKVDTVTVHTNIPASTVVTGSLALNGVAPKSVGVDNCGHVVGKFAVADLDLAPGSVTLTLTGDFTAGGSFRASDTVLVK